MVFRIHRDKWQTLLPVWLAAVTSPKLVANKAKQCRPLRNVFLPSSSSSFFFHHDLTFLESPACFSVKEADCSWNARKIKTENAVCWRFGKMDEWGFRVEIWAFQLPRRARIRNLVFHACDIYLFFFTMICLHINAATLTFKHRLNQQLQSRHFKNMSFRMFFFSFSPTFFFLPVLSPSNCLAATSLNRHAVCVLFFFFYLDGTLQSAAL